MLLERAVRLNPRDPTTRQALRLVRRGEHVNIQELNRSIRSKLSSWRESAKTRSQICGFRLDLARTFASVCEGI